LTATRFAPACPYARNPFAEVRSSVSTKKSALGQPQSGPSWYHCKKGLTNEESVRQRVAVIHYPVSEATDERIAFDLGDDSLEVAHGRFAQHTSFENSADDGLVNKRFVFPQLASKIELRNAPAGS
jgi:hypothetical protein